MKNAVIVPLRQPAAPFYSSTSGSHDGGLQHGGRHQPNIGGPDITNVWLKQRLIEPARCPAGYALTLPAGTGSCYD